MNARAAVLSKLLATTAPPDSVLASYNVDAVDSDRLLTVAFSHRSARSTKGRDET